MQLQSNVMWLGTLGTYLPKQPKQGATRAGRHYLLCTVDFDTRYLLYKVPTMAPMCRAEIFSVDE